MSKTSEIVLKEIENAERGDMRNPSVPDCLYWSIEAVAEYFERTFPQYRVKNRLKFVLIQELNMQCDLFKMTSDENEQAMLKYLRVPNRRANEEQKQQANEEVYMFKKKYHQVNILHKSYLKYLKIIQTFNRPP